MDLRLPLAAEKLIPHRSPMRLVDRLLEVQGKNGVVDSLVDTACPLVSAEGELEDAALIELIAQAYAAVKGYSDLLAAKPVRQGFLVGVKTVVRRQSVAAGDRLRIEIRTVAELGDFAVAEGEIWRDGEMIANGEIKVWIN